MEAFVIAQWGPVLVGLVFATVGLLKAATPSSFLNHVAKLRLAPPRLLRFVVPVFIVGEVALGAALVVGLAPAVLWPATLTLLLALAGLTIWSTSTGRVEDCGCYHGLLEVTPRQSVALDLLYAALVGAAWATLPEGAAGGGAVRWGVVAGATVGGAILLAVAIRRLFTTGEALLDLGPLREGRRWKRSWLPAAPAELVEGERLVVFLSTTCPHCKRWVKLLNLIHRRPDLPPVQGALVAPLADLATFALGEGVRFPLVASRRNLVWHTLPGVPTAVQLVDGEIRGRWTGGLDPAFLDRIRPGLAEQAKAAQQKRMAEIMAQAAAAQAAAEAGEAPEAGATAPLAETGE